MMSVLVHSERALVLSLNLLSVLTHHQITRIICLVALHAARASFAGRDNYVSAL